MKYLFKSILILLTMAVIVTACGSQKEANHEEHSHQEHASSDIQEKTASANVLPSFLKSQPEQVRLVYEASGLATDILKWIPCYCGCGDSAGHRSNMNCFVRKLMQTARLYGMTTALVVEFACKLPCSRSI